MTTTLARITPRAATNSQLPSDGVEVPAPTVAVFGSVGTSVAPASEASKLGTSVAPSWEASKLGGWLSPPGPVQKTAWLRPAGPSLALSGANRLPSEATPPG